jgi:two-component system nitrate/nitrite response regulator NarL
LRALLEATSDIKVLAGASNGLEALTKITLRCPDVAVIDISMPVMDGIQTGKLLLKRCPSTRIVMLSIYDNVEYVQRALEMGAYGYILKDKIDTDLLAAVRALFQGGKYFSQKIAQIASQYFNHNYPDGTPG